MSNRCPDCNKFAMLELQDPEEQYANFSSESGHIEADYRVVRTCGDCGTEMKEATVSFEDDVPVDIVNQHQGEGHELTADFEPEQLEEGGSRYAKSYYGVSLHVSVSCKCGTEILYENDMEEKVAASEMDDLN